MIKSALKRGLNSFIYAVAINVILAFVIMAIVDQPDFVPLVPDYVAYFESKYVALLLQIILIGMTSAVFGAGSVILEVERWSLLKQSLIYFIVTTIVWVPVSMFCWRVDKYPVAGISIMLSYTFSYLVTWIIQYYMCKKSVAEINQKLEEIKEE